MARKWKSKCVSTSLTCTIEFLHEEVKLSNTYCVRYAHSKHNESHLGKKQLQMWKKTKQMSMQKDSSDFKAMNVAELKQYLQDRGV